MEDQVTGSRNQISRMEEDYCEQEPLSSMWQQDLQEESRKQFNIEEKSFTEQIQLLEELNIKEDRYKIDFTRLSELTDCSEIGSHQLTSLVKQYKFRKENAVRLLHEEINSLSKQRLEMEQTELEILDEEVTGDYGDVVYWRGKAMELERMLRGSLKRECLLEQKLKQSLKGLEQKEVPFEELSSILKRADNFLHFILQNAPVVIAHQDTELRYRFVYNHFPALGEEDIIGKMDEEILSGDGVKQFQEFKREVLENGKPSKREITYETPLFGKKTFLFYVEPVFDKKSHIFGINYIGLEVSDQVRKREKLARNREELAVQKAKEAEFALNLTVCSDSKLLKL